MIGEDWDAEERPPGKGCSWLLLTIVVFLFLLVAAGFTAFGLLFYAGMAVLG
ncbi:hypothetical protein [Streptomyces sp. NPDC003635]